MRILKFSIVAFVTLWMLAAEALPIALVYKGPGVCQGCETALAKVLQRSGYSVKYVGPTGLTEAVFARAKLYVQPGGSDRVADVIEALQAAADPSFPNEKIDLIKKFVASGGRYLGVCSGAFLAGTRVLDESPRGHLINGFGLVPDLIRDENIDDPKFSTRAKVETIQIHQGGKKCPAQMSEMYFQDGPELPATGKHLHIWASYKNTGHPAAVSVHFGRGLVALVGPHPEASEDWFEDDGLKPPQDLRCNHDFLQSLINSL